MRKAVLLLSLWAAPLSGLTGEGEATAVSCPSAFGVTIAITTYTIVPTSIATSATTTSSTTHRYHHCYCCHHCPL